MAIRIRGNPAWIAAEKIRAPRTHKFLERMLPGADAPISSIAQAAVLVQTANCAKAENAKQAWMHRNRCLWKILKMARNALFYQQLPNSAEFGGGPVSDGRRHGPVCRK